MFCFKRTDRIESFDILASSELTSIEKTIAKGNIKNWGLIFKLSPEKLKLVRKIQENSIPLCEIFDETSQGLIAYDKYRGQDEETIKNRIYHADKKINESYKMWMWGEDVTRYAVKWNGKEYINYCQGIANPRDPKYFEGKRILVREITNPRIYAAITGEEMYNDPAIIIIKDSTSSFSLESLLAILNSKLATFYHFNSSPKATKGAFPKILVNDINNFPLPKKIDINQDSRLKQLVLKIIDLKATNTPFSSEIDNEIDKIVYQLYGLTDEEIEIVERG
jgi:hypothetical protein